MYLTGIEDQFKFEVGELKRSIEPKRYLQLGKKQKRRIVCDHCTEMISRYLMKSIYDESQLWDELTKFVGEAGETDLDIEKIFSDRLELIIEYVVAEIDNVMENNGDFKFAQLNVHT